LTGSTADLLKKIFFEVIVATEYDEGALEALKKRKKLRLIKMPLGYWETSDVKTVPGGFVFQQKDNLQVNPKDFILKTSRQITSAEKKDIAFGWRLIKFVKSNGIIITRNHKLIGVGAGQMSRVDAVDIAIRKCETSPRGGVLLSDAFFPFPDSIEIAAKHDIKVVVEPGGSIRDEEVIRAAEHHGISLLFTGIRHFRH
jgi:phosphoribosylaminoimidazolecarboxamide formyltransferase/IMP cyclohydrolase